MDFTGMQDHVRNYGCSLVQLMQCLVLSQVCMQSPLVIVLSS